MAYFANKFGVVDLEFRGDRTTTMGVGLVHNIKKQQPRTDVRKYFFSNRVVDRWNSLPSDVKKSESIVTFKNHIVRLIK